MILCSQEWMTGTGRLHFGYNTCRKTDEVGCLGKIAELEGWRAQLVKFVSAKG